jgi:hydrogenase maturation factor
MRVVSVSTDGAVCLDEDGGRHEAVAVDLVGPVAPGDRVLVHAGVAIA